MAIKFLRLAETLSRRGTKRSSHNNDVRRGLFTRPVRLGVRQVGWPEHEVEALNRARLGGAGDVEIRALVQALEAARADEFTAVRPLIERHGHRARLKLGGLAALRRQSETSGCRAMRRRSQLSFGAGPVDSGDGIESRVNPLRSSELSQSGNSFGSVVSLPSVPGTHVT